MEYFPQTAPKMESVEDLQKFVENEFQLIARVMKESDILRQRVLHVEPPKPREGMVAQADGSDWDPGQGAGTYNYVGGQWVLMTSGNNFAPPDPDYIVGAAHAGLTAERVATDTATIDVDMATAAQAKWNLITPVTVANGGTGQVTAPEAVGELTQALTEDTTPDRILDMTAVYDDSADTGKKVALYNMAGMVVLAAGSVSGAAALDLALDAFTQFKLFRLVLYNGVVETDSTTIFLRFSDDGGATFEADAADYGWENTDSSDASDSEIEISSSGIGNVAPEGFWLDLLIYNPAAAVVTRASWSGGRLNNAGTTVRMEGCGTSLVAAATTDIRIVPSSGNFSCGYTLMGIL